MSRSRIWTLRKRHDLVPTLRRSAERSPNLRLLALADGGSELRAVLEFGVRTLVKSPESDIQLAGPVEVGIRYAESFLSQAPHPQEIAQVLTPIGVFHPNIAAHGALCLGSPDSTHAYSLDDILHRVFAALVFHMELVNTRPFQILNAEAAAYVRAHAPQFPLTRRGLFEELEPEVRAALPTERREPSSGSEALSALFNALNGPRRGARARSPAPDQFPNTDPGPTD